MSQSIAIFDPDAFYPFRSLVKGPFTNWNEIDALERFIRAIVLHDNMFMIFTPVSYDKEAHEELKREHPDQNVFVTAMGPVIGDYNGLFSTQKDLIIENVQITRLKLLNLVAQFSNAQPGNIYYNSHIKFLQIILAVEKKGGSLVCDGEFSRAIELTAQEYPQKLFDVLDSDWKEYAQAINNGYHGPNIPPVLGIVLNRCANRDQIPIVLKELRDEWSEARKKVWTLISELRIAKTLKEANQIKQELDNSSKYFSPKRSNNDFSPMRIFWELFSEVGCGVIDTAIAGGDPLIGALSATTRTVIKKFADGGLEFAKTLFGSGAFDLARRVRHDAMQIAPMPHLIKKILTKTEREKLSL